MNQEQTMEDLLNKEPNIFIGWVISTAGIFGSVREMIETSNVLEEHAIDVTIFTKDGLYNGWLPCSARFARIDDIDHYHIDLLILMNDPVSEPDLFEAWKKADVQVRSYCMMGFPPERLHETPGMFFNKDLDWIVRNAWIIMDGEWQREYLNMFTDDLGPAIGGINLDMFYPVEVSDRVDVVYSDDPRPRKDSATVRKAVRGLSSITYFGKGYAQEDMRRVLCTGRVFVDGHRSGGWCNPVLEAMACGVPVVATDIGCVRSVVLGYDDAISLVRPGNPNHMRNCIDYLLNDETLYNDQRKHALMIAMQHDYKRVAAAFAYDIKLKLNRV